MKSLIRWGATLGLVISTIVSPGLSKLRPAWALPTAEVTNLLKSIPVYAVVDDKNIPLAGQIDEKTVFTNIFMSQQNAQEFLDEFKKEKPDVANQYKVQLISLGAIYQVAQEHSNESQRLLLQYIPNSAEVEAAKPILSSNGKEYKGGVPLYLAKAGPEQNYLTTEVNGETILPVFFEKKAIQQSIDNLKKENPEQASDITIEVVLLNNLIATLEEKDDEFLKNIRFILSEEMTNIIRVNGQNRDNQPNQPQ